MRDRDLARAVLLVGSLLFLADLFLPWQDVHMRAAGIVGLRATSVGWAGWGGLAGGCAIFVVVLLLAGRERRDRPGALLAGALGMLAGTVIAIATGSASLHMSSMMGIDVETTRWPAWVGLGLAAVAVATSAVLVMQRSDANGGAAARGPRSRAAGQH